LIDNTNLFLKDKAIKSAIRYSIDIIEEGEYENLNKIRSLVEDALCKDIKMDLGLDYFNNLSSRLKKIMSQGDIRVPTYYPQFDEYINGGFPPFTLSVILAKIHGFKSNTLANFAARQVLNGLNVVLTSLEMSEYAFAQRFDSIFTDLNINRIYTSRKVTKELAKKLKEIKNKEGRGNLFISAVEPSPVGNCLIKRLP
jgi:replicative DNA helicase